MEQAVASRPKYLRNVGMPVLPIPRRRGGVDIEARHDTEHSLRRRRSSESKFYQEPGAQATRSGLHFGKPLTLTATIHRVFSP